MSVDKRHLLWVGVVSATLAFSVLGLASPAGAHVGITPSTTTVGAYAVLELSVPHGCDGSPTTEVKIQIPDAINAVVPTRNPLWGVEKQVIILDPPVADGHGGEITERVASITYRADVPLPDGYRDTFELSMQLPDAEGAVLVFPTIQTCEQGESAWIEVAQGGVGAEDLELPAPAFVLTAAGEPDAVTAATAATDAADALGAAAAAGARPGASDVQGATRSGADDALTAGALGFGLVGAMMGGAALVRLRRRA